MTSVIVEGLSFSGVGLSGNDRHSPSSSWSSSSSMSSSLALKSIPSTMANLAMFVAVTSLNLTLIKIVKQKQFNLLFFIVYHLSCC